MEEVSKEPIADKPSKKKIKLHSNVRKSQRTMKKPKKVEILDKKIDILDLMRENEEENLKAKMLEIKIKLIVKQQEMMFILCFWQTYFFFWPKIQFFFQKVGS